MFDCALDELIQADALGCGCLYVRHGIVANIDPYFGSLEFPAGDIRSRIYPGSPNFAAESPSPAWFGAMGAFYLLRSSQSSAIKCST